jgi:hypothetical protein
MSSSLTHLLIRIQGKIETRTRRPWFDLQRTYYYKDARAVKSVQGEWGGRAAGLGVDSRPSGCAAGTSACILQSASVADVSVIEWNLLRV